MLCECCAERAYIGTMCLDCHARALKLCALTRACRNLRETARSYSRGVAGHFELRDAINWARLCVLDADRVASRRAMRLACA